MTTAELTELKRKLRQLLPDEGISAVINALKAALPEIAPKYSTVFQLETRLNMANRDKIRGVLSQEQLELAYNRIAADLIEFVDDLQEEDFAPTGAAAKTGSILYKIPSKMQLERETRCIVRLAFEEDVIIRNIELTDAVLKPVRVSEVMEVALVDPNDEPVFEIREVNSAEQFLEKGDFTEWLFYVTPLRTGEFPLALRVSVVEVVAGKDRKKEIVLEETVQVLAEPDKDGFEETATFQNSGYAFSYSVESDTPAEEPQAKSNNGRRLGAALLLLLLVAGGVWAFDLRERFSWFRATQADTKESYEKYLEKYSAGRHSHQALLKIDSLDWLEATQSGADTSAYLHYLELHPEGMYKMDAQRMLDSLRRLDPDGLTTGLSAGPPGSPDSTTAPLAGQEPVIKPSNQDKQSGRNRKQPAKPAPAPKKEPGAVTVPPTPEIKPPVTQAPTPARRSGFEMVDVPGGKFTMGSEKGEKDECPHEVTLKTFNIGKYEVTQADWKEIMGSNPAFYKGCGECPVENVSWNDVQTFISKASAIRGVRYRLPTEAEWEYAARGGLQSQNFTYAGSNRAGAVAWYHGNTEKPNRVGRKKANELGIHDMSGNVWEWCQDTYQPYPGCQGKSSEDRVLRGGGWRNYDSVCRTGNRSHENAGKRDYQMGFRLARD